MLLPTYNESAALEPFVRELLAQQDNLGGCCLKLLIVDSQSPDGTADVARRLAAEDPRIEFLEVGRGLGVALVEGHRYALEHLQPDVMAQLDADGQVEADVLPRLVAGISQGYDLVLGSRFVKGGRNELPLHRRLFSFGSSLVFRTLVGPPSIKEVTNLSRAFTPELFKKMDLDRLPWREKTFIFLPAFLNEAIRAGARCKEVPLVFKDREEGLSKNQVRAYVYDMLVYCLQARLEKWGLRLPLFAMTHRTRHNQGEI